MSEDSSDGRRRGPGRRFGGGRPGERDPNAPRTFDPEESFTPSRPLPASRGEDVGGQAGGWDRGQRRSVQWGDDDDGDGGRDLGGRTGTFVRSATRKVQRASLLDLSLPVFALSALLPHQESDAQPNYAQFREQALTALTRLEAEANDAGIQRADWDAARYALALFLDEQVAGSAWSEKMRWATEPLNIVLNKDPQGGVNFYQKLEGFLEEQRESRAVFIACLALGYRGMYAGLPPDEQRVRIAELRQKHLRLISANSPEDAKWLFPEAYRDAARLREPQKPLPIWWWLVSVGTFLFLIALYFVLSWQAGQAGRKALEGLTRSAAPPVVATVGAA